MFKGSLKYDFLLNRSIRLIVVSNGSLCPPSIKVLMVLPHHICSMKRPHMSLLIIIIYIKIWVVRPPQENC